MTVNAIAVLLAAVSSMVVGTVWYLPRVFGDRWQAITGKNPSKPRNPAATYSGSFVAAAVTAVVLEIASGLVHESVGGSSVLVAVATAVVLWAGFTAAPSAVHYLFEGRGVPLFAINVLHQLATALVMAIIIGLFG
ncbi:DUF1761 domain-containing protein [Herbiconiux moechotypicola]|uniref:DUF1761 domain-containing protein n=1 Tax=Herbiconiux moechotypicola TaxID=637393 RepID=A0ABN3DS92_9MICO|nr:DUF1761 domain-containing protein [Herbiconiux moechotypicola]MCS5730654.1 DUF1761 domain-containing protein [Herbiconiux moechotypicola]